MNSNPTAPAAIFLDFDGGSFYAGTGTSYNSAGSDPSTFDSGEQERIVQTWREVSMYFSAFNVNVTTVQPNVATTPTAWALITNSWGIGQSIVGAFPNRSIADSVIGSSEVPGRISEVAHELGHNFGLDHTSTYDAWGVDVANYSGALDNLHGPIMGLDYSGTINKFTAWHEEPGPTTLQDDVAVIAGAIAAQVGGDGFRPDDFGPTTFNPSSPLSGATALTASGSTQYKVGDIERLADADTFSFNIASGTYDITVGRDRPSAVDVNIAVYNSSGTLLASTDQGDPQTQSATMVNDSHLTMTLAAGTYYVVVTSHGNYDDLGQYVVRVDPQASGWVYADVGNTGVPGYGSYNSATGTYTVAGSGDIMFGNVDSFGFNYQVLSGDGSITARVTGLGLGTGSAKAGVMIRQSLAPGAINAVMELQGAHSSTLQWRDTLNGSSGFVSGPAVTAPYYVRLTRTGNLVTGLVSSDGTNWTTVGSLNLAMTGNVLIGLVATDEANNLVDLASFTNVSLTGTLNPGPTLNSLASPGTLTITSTAYNSVGLSWTNVSGETGYSVERSSDNITFAQFGTTGANIVTFTDNSVLDDQRYYYRVRATNAAGVSNPSPTKNTVTRAGTVTNLRVMSPGTTDLVVDWTDTSGETNYTLQRSPNGTGSWTTVGTIAQNLTIFDNTGLTSNTHYFYRLRTNDASGVSATSAVVSNYTRLNNITGLAFTTKASNQMAFSWSSLSGATGYLIERSTDNATWTTLATNQPGTSYNDTTVSPLTEYYYRVTGVNANTKSVAPASIFAATPATASLPSPWAHADIGAPIGTGAAGYTTGGTFTLIGGGNMLFGTADQLQFAYVTTTSTSAFVQARVANMDGASPTTKVGVMIRQSLATGAPNVVMEIEGPASTFQWRDTNNGDSGFVGGPNVNVPYYVRVSRSGNVFTGQISSDGSTWTTVASVTVAMSGTVYEGLVVSAESTTSLSTDQFSNVSTDVTGLVSSAAPVVHLQSVAIGDGTDQRSVVRSINVIFDGAITTAPSAAFMLYRTTDNLSIPVTLAGVAPAFGGNSSVTLSFGGTALINGSLPDGQYVLRIDGGKIFDAAGQPLDAARSGALGSVASQLFFRLFGDATGDGNVNGLDIAAVASHWLAADSDADVNADGVVNGLDLAVVNSNWLASIAPGGAFASSNNNSAALALAATGGSKSPMQSAAMTAATCYALELRDHEIIDTIGSDTARQKPKRLFI